MSSINTDRLPVWRRPKEAIRVFGISPATLYRWIENKIVRTKKIQGCRFVDVSEFIQPGSEDTIPDLTPLLKRIATQTKEEEGA